MEKIRIELSYDPLKEDHQMIKEDINYMLLENKQLFDNQQISLEMVYQHQSELNLKINQQPLDLVCHCHENPEECQCEISDKLRKELFGLAQLTYTCGCGGSCGCH